MSKETEIVLTYREFRERAIPVAGPEKGSVIPYDIHLRANNKAVIGDSIYSVVTSNVSDSVTLTYEKEIELNEQL